jgi:predicted nucleic acid-binding protein
MKQVRVMFKVYLDKSVISVLFDSKNPERQELTKLFFDNIHKFEVFVSRLTIVEIENTPNSQLKAKMKSIANKLKVLEIENKVEELTENYINYKAVPEAYKEDAYHIAIAVCSNMDYLLSWNFRHLVRLKTKDTVRMVNTLKGFKNIEIITPAELL